MIPVGYNAKIVARPEPWLGSDAVEEILSVSECMSPSPIDHASLWLCNSWWLYDSERLLEQALSLSSIPERAVVRRFFYEVHPEFLKEGRRFPAVDVPSSAVARSEELLLRGFDVTCFPSGPPDCSPLSCNSGAKEFEVNRYCLLDTLDQALEVAASIDGGAYEPGPYGVLAVWEAGHQLVSAADDASRRS